MSLGLPSDIVGSSKSRGRPLGLLLVAIPVLLVFWMVIFPIISAVVTTLWQKDASGQYGLTAKTYQFFFQGEQIVNVDRPVD